MIKNDILQLLKKSKTGFVSGGEMAEKFALSRTAVWKHVKTLERDGYIIEGIPSKGYRLVTAPDAIPLSGIIENLATKLIGRDIRLLPRIESTNTLGMELARNDAPEGTAIVAETQTGGKGRLGRTWISPRGNLYLSVILRPKIPPHKAGLITLMGAVGVASAIRKQLGLRAGIKWPNDIILSGRKAGGLLAEMSAEPDRVRHIVLGIGLNVNMDLTELPGNIRAVSTTLALESGRNIDRASLLREVLLELDRWYRLFLRNERAVLAEWEKLNVTLGCRVAVSGLGEKFEGTAQGIDEEGRLILRLDSGGTRQVAAGDVTILKGSGAR